MKKIIFPYLAIGLLFSTPLSYAHYPILMLSKSPIKIKQRGTVNVIYGRGHLYKHEMSTAPRPDWVRAISFDGMVKDLSSSLKKNGNIFTMPWQIKRPGDNWIVAHIPLGWSDHDMSWVETTVRTVAHIGFSKGWEEPLGLAKVEILPLTRPYGLLPGDVMRVKILKDGKGVPGQKLYAGKYYASKTEDAEPPTELLTRAAKADSAGVAAITLRRPGWWVLFTVVEDGEKKVGQKEGVVQREDALWVHVEGNF